ncbi:DEKNAAC100989 [Brettanomyces naardenensis]|uniref:DEKNAAC100989 n=1 Tax=Brettanomyces naardenensis TaxID=13370 RepID=A0A448YH15_BRENA|nr:DEKNAAC100989 [Brettanomyces naardenensis]
MPDKSSRSRAGSVKFTSTTNKRSSTSSTSLLSGSSTSTPIKRNKSGRRTVSGLASDLKARLRSKSKSLIVPNNSYTDDSTSSSQLEPTAISPEPRSTRFSFEKTPSKLEKEPSHLQKDFKSPTKKYPSTLYPAKSLQLHRKSTGKSFQSTDTEDGLEIHGGFSIANNRSSPSEKLGPSVSGPIRTNGTPTKSRYTVQNPAPSTETSNSPPPLPPNSNALKTPEIRVSSGSPARTQNGIFSTLINSLSLKSLGDLGTKTGIFSEERLTGAPTGGGQPDVNSGNFDRRSLNLLRSTSPISENTVKSASAEDVPFIPVKKSLLSTLGHGGLTLASVLNENKENDSEEDDNLEGAVEDDEDEEEQGEDDEGDVGHDGFQDTTATDSSLAPLLGKQSILSSSDLPAMKLKVSGGRSRSKSVNDAMSGNGGYKGLQREDSSARKKGRIAVTMPAVSDSQSEYGSDYTDRRKENMAKKLGVKLPNEKRQEAFRLLFPELPVSEIFIEDFACAYRKDILIQGRLYLSERQIAFHSNIIGLITHFSVPLCKILSMQKKKTMGIPNAIEFSTLHDKFPFATFLARDSTYDLIYKAWSLADGKFLNGALETFDIDLDDDEVESQDPVSESDDEYEEEEEAQEADNLLDNESESSISDAENMVKDSDEEPKKQTSTGHFNGIAFEGPSHHKPTASGYTAEPNESVITESNIEAPLGVVFGLLFGSDTTFASDILKAQGNFNVSELPKFVNNERKFTYTKPLDGPVGPKQTRCIISEQIEKKDFEDSCVVIQQSETPDVPSGGSFRVRTRYFFNWAEADSTNMSVYSSVIWTGKSWIKSAVDRGAISGQKKSTETLLQELRKKIQAGEKTVRPRKKTVSSRKSTIPQKLVEPAELQQPSVETEKVGRSVWVQLLGSTLDVKTVLIFMLFVLLLWSRYHPYEPQHNRRPGRLQRSSPISPLADHAFDSNLMLQSEADLWDWIDKRQKGTGRASSRKAESAGSILMDPNFEMDAEDVQRTGSKLNSQELSEMVHLLEKRLEILRGATGQIH